MPDRSAFIGRLAGTTQILFAVLLGIVASLRFEPEFVPRGTVVMAVFAIPGVIGLLGVRARRPALLVAAGLATFLGSFTAFSLVTLIFLIPSLLFFVGAVQLVTGAPRARGGGALGTIAQIGLALVIVPLVISAGASALLLTDSACWSEFPTPAGPRIEVQPYTNGEIELTEPGTSMTCSTGLISPLGVGLAVVLDGAAVAFALLATRRRPATA